MIMNETYVEHLIEKRTGAGENLIRIGVYVLTLLSFGAGIFISPLFFLLCIGGGALCYFFLPTLDLEYEYLYLSKTLTIDKIFSKEKRKKAEEFDLEKMEIYAEEGAWQLDRYKDLNCKELDYTSRFPDRRRFIMVIRDGEDVKKVILEPDDRMNEAIKTVYPSKVFFK